MPEAHRRREASTERVQDKSPHYRSIHPNEVLQWYIMILDQPSSALPPTVHRTVLAHPTSRRTVRLVTGRSGCVRDLVGGRPKSIVARREHLSLVSRPSDLSVCWLLQPQQLMHSHGYIATSAHDDSPLIGAGRLTEVGMLVGWSPDTGSEAQPSSVGDAALPCIPSLWVTSRARWRVHPRGLVPPVLRFTFSRAWLNETGSSSSFWNVTCASARRNCPHDAPKKPPTVARSATRFSGAGGLRR